MELRLTENFPSYVEIYAFAIYLHTAVLIEGGGGGDGNKETDKKTFEKDCTIYANNFDP